MSKRRTNRKPPLHPASSACQSVPRLIDGTELYPHRADLAHVKAWICSDCGSRVGCHDGGTVAKGDLADLATRQARMRAHAAFDPIWKGIAGREQRKARSAAYKWLAGELGLAWNDTHIGQFDVATCERVVVLCRERVENREVEA